MMFILTRSCSFLRSTIGNRLLIVAAFMGFFSHLAFAEVHFVVGSAPGADFSSIQDAVDAVPNSNTVRHVIDIMPGTYMERVIVPDDKQYVTLRGHGLDPSDTVLTFNEPADALPNESTNHATLVVRSKDFVAENMTFENTYGVGKQALAAYLRGDRSIFDNVRFLGNQDTLRSEKSRHYLHDVYVEGTVDFIYGRGQAYFENATIYAKSSGYVTAQAREAAEETNGFIFKDSTITGSASSGSVYLGRPWQAYSRTVFIDTKMSDVINSQGWSQWGGNSNHLTAYYAEYNSMDLAGNPIITSNRVSWSHQLTAQELDPYSKVNWLNGWNPTLSNLPDPSADLNSDNVINGADYLAVLRDFGTGATSGDTNGDGVVNAIDVMHWQNSFGTTTIAQSQHNLVPEPSGIVLLLIVVIVSIVYFRLEARSLAIRR